MWDADEKFVKEVSSNPRKKQDVDAITHARQDEKHLQVMKRANCRYIGLKKEYLQKRISRSCRYVS